MVMVRIAYQGSFEDDEDDDDDDSSTRSSDFEDADAGEKRADVSLRHTAVVESVVVSVLCWERGEVKRVG